MFTVIWLRSVRLMMHYVAIIIAVFLVHSSLAQTTFTTLADLQAAVNAWISDPAITTYGPIATWNTNAVTGVLAAFNLQGARWDRKRRRFTGRDDVPSVTARLRPADVEGLLERMSTRCQEDARAAHEGADEVTESMEFDGANELGALVVDEEAPDGCSVSGSGTAVSGLSALYLHQQRRLVLVHAEGGLEIGVGAGVG